MGQVLELTLKESSIKPVITLQGINEAAQTYQVNVPTDAMNPVNFHWAGNFTDLRGEFQAYMEMYKGHPDELRR